MTEREQTKRLLWAAGAGIFAALAAVHIAVAFRSDFDWSSAHGGLGWVLFGAQSAACAGALWRWSSDYRAGD